MRDLKRPSIPWSESHFQAPGHPEAAACKSETEDPQRVEERSGIPGPRNYCSKVYIGEKTKRTLKIRVTKHKQAVRSGDLKNGIVVHAHTTNYIIDWEGA